MLFVGNNFNEMCAERYLVLTVMRSTMAIRAETNNPLGMIGAAVGKSSDMMTFQIEMSSNCLEWRITITPFTKTVCTF